VEKPPKTPPYEENDDLLEYMTFLACLTENRKVQKSEMKQALSVWKKKWRQRPLSFWFRRYKLPFGWFKKHGPG
jgi:hypothetical protein